ncbi:hypothetical protein Peur_058805 [Populus x canadensis]
MAFIPKTSTFSLEKKSSFIFNLTLPQSTAYPLSINFGWTILLISFPFIFLHYHPLTQQQLPFPTMTVTTGTNHCEQYAFSTKRYNRSIHHVQQSVTSSASTKPATDDVCGNSTTPLTP